MIRKSSIFLFSFLITGCAAGPLAVVGVSSIAVTETTGKGIVDHGMSIAEGKDCRLGRAFKDQQVCQNLSISSDRNDSVISAKSNGAPVKSAEDIFEKRKQNAGNQVR